MQDQFAHERRKLRLLVQSVEAVQSADHLWESQAWRRVLARVLAHARKEESVLGYVENGTVRLFEAVWDALEMLGTAPDEGLGLRERWLCLALYVGVWDDDTVASAAAKFNQALADGETKRAEAVLGATWALVHRWGDNTFEADDDTFSVIVRDAKAFVLEAAFPAAHDDGRHEPLRDGNPGRIITSTGRTGAPAHRPHRGTKVPGTAEQRLLAACPGRTIEELRRAARTRGKPSAEMRAIRSDLERGVYHVRQTQTSTNEALAAALGCSVRSIHRLRGAGENRLAA